MSPAMNILYNIENISHKEKTKQFNVYVKQEKIINKKQLMEHACKNIIHTCVSIVLCHQRNLQRVMPPCMQVDYLR